MRNNYLEILHINISQCDKQLEDIYMLLVNFTEKEKQGIGRDTVYDLVNPSCCLHNVIKDIPYEGLSIISESSELTDYYELMSEIFEDNSKEFRKKLVEKTILPCLVDYVYELLDKNLYNTIDKGVSEIKSFK